VQWRRRPDRGRKQASLQEKGGKMEWGKKQKGKKLGGQRGHGGMVLSKMWDKKSQEQS